MAAGWKHNLGLLGNGRLVAWGWGGAVGTSSSLYPSDSEGGQLGTGQDWDCWDPTAVPVLACGEQAWTNYEDGPQSWRATQISAGFQHSAAIVELVQ